MSYRGPGCFGPLGQGNMVTGVKVTRINGQGVSAAYFIETKAAILSLLLRIQHWKYTLLVHEY